MMALVPSYEMASELSGPSRALPVFKVLLAAERILATTAHSSPADAFNQVLLAVEDGDDVHRIVMPHRAWELLDLVGKEHAETMLRQSVHYCINVEKNQKTADYYQPMRAMLPKLIDQYKLLSKPLGTQTADD